MSPEWLTAPITLHDEITRSAGFMTGTSWETVPCQVGLPSCWLACQLRSLEKFLASMIPECARRKQAGIHKALPHPCRVTADINNYQEWAQKQSFTTLQR